jgi:sugar O-acyltransferase (sialic acid O-acetyltransferase NeuD family)
MSKDLIIIGNGEFATIAREYFDNYSEYKVRGFAVDSNYMDQTSKRDLPVHSTSEVISKMKRDFKVFVAITSSNLNRDRERIYLKFKNQGFSFATFISPYAFISSSASIRENCFIFENNVVQSNAKIGANCILWSGNHIGHSTSVEDNVFISSHCVISGFCRIGKNCFLGVNCTLLDGVTLADNTFVGASSLVNRNTEPNGLYYGSPATRKKNILA